MDETTRCNLLKQLNIITLSQQTIGVIIFAVALSYINVNKIRVGILDQLNGTKCADDLPDTTYLPLLTSILIVYGGYIFLYIAYEALIEGIKVYNKSPKKKKDKKILEGLYEAYLASAFVFVAALIRISNINTRSEELEVDV